MFLLGHVAYSYIVSKSSAKPLGAKIPISLAIMLGILPDLDILLQGLGVPHHTLTHSFIFWLPVAIIFAAKLGSKSIPLILGIYSHLAADAIVGTVPALLPISSIEVGLSLPIPSLYDAALEVGGLTAALLYMYTNGDLSILLRGSRQNLTVSVPVIAIVALSTLFANHNEISIVTYAFSRWAMTAITIGHIILLALLSTGVCTGVLTYWTTLGGNLDSLPASSSLESKRRQKRS
ncbi:MAG: metal-dependent hydrolase [Thaumarchaeota archaeon]|nr:metal-dependent hydrolase [Nitrososphaerota archaeon]